MWYNRPLFAALSASDLREIKIAFHETRDNLRGRGRQAARLYEPFTILTDSRDDFREWVHALLNDVVDNRLDDEETPAALYAIGRDLARARYYHSR